MASKKEATLWLRIKESGSDILEKTSSIFDGMKKTVEAVGATIGVVITAAIYNYRQQEEALNSLTQAMVNNGIYSKELKNEYVAQASALQELTTFGDEQIIAAQAAVQQQIGQTRVTKELTAAILDFATAQKMDVASAAELVGKTIGTSTNALARQGIEINTNATKQEKLTQVVDGLNRKFGGQAEAAAKGVGTLIQLKNAVSDLLEDLGERLAPTIAIVTTELRGMVSEVRTNRTAVVGFADAINDLARISAGVFDQVMEGIVSFGIRMSGASERFRALLSGDEAAFYKNVNETNAALQMVADDYLMKRIAREREFEQIRINEANANAAEEIALKQRTNAAKASADENAFLEDQIKKQEQQNLTTQQELAWMMADEEQKAALRVQFADAEFARASTDAERLRALRDKYNALEIQKETAKKKQLENLEQQHAQAKVNILQGFANLATAIGEQGSKEVFLIQQAAALAGAIVAMNLAVAQALAVPPAPNFALASAAKFAGGLNIAAIGATTIRGLAEGGIVKARPGGNIFRIGEAGQDEAVIPLDKAGNLGGSQVVLQVGLFLGTEAEAYEAATKIDRALYDLKQQGGSVLFGRS